MELSGFEARIAEALGTPKRQQIADLLGVNYQTLSNWLNGRAEFPVRALAEIANRSDYSLNWILTGGGEKRTAKATAALAVSDHLTEKLRTIAHEQAPVIFAAAEVAGGSAADERTLNLLTEYLLNDALMTHNVISEPLMPRGEWQRARKMSFVAGREKSIEERFREIVGDELRRLTSTEEDLGGEVEPVKWGQERGERLIGNEEIDEIQRRLKRRKAG